MTPSNIKMNFVFSKQPDLEGNSLQHRSLWSFELNMPKVLLYMLFSCIFFLVSSSLYAQEEIVPINLNRGDSSSIDSILNTFNVRDIDSAEAYSFWQSINDSIGGLDSIVADYSTVNTTLSIMNENGPEFNDLFSNQFSSEGMHSFGIDIRTNIPVAIVSIPNAFFGEGNIRANNVSKGDGLGDSVTSEVSIPISVGVGFKYYLNTNLALAISFDKGSLSGMQNKVNTTLSHNVNDYKAFINNFKSYGISLEMNPVGLFSKNENSSAFKSWFTLGIGYVDSDVKAYRCDGKIKAYQFVCFATTVGIKVSYAVSPSCDLTCGSTLNMVETAYLDGIPNDHKKSDKMLLNSVGVAYKFNISSH